MPCVLMRKTGMAPAALELSLIIPLQVKKIYAIKDIKHRAVMEHGLNEVMFINT